MAQTKKRRKKKHKRDPGRLDQQAIETAARETATRRERRPAGTQSSSATAAPTWQSAFNRSLIMSAILFVLMAFVVGQPIGASAVLSIFMLGLYTPAGYYLERFLYRRRMAKEQAARQAARAQATGRAPRR